MGRPDRESQVDPGSFSLSSPLSLRLSSPPSRASDNLLLFSLNRFFFFFFDFEAPVDDCETSRGSEDTLRFSPAPPGADPASLIHRSCFVNKA